MSGGHGGHHGVLRGMITPLLWRRHGLRRGDGSRDRVSVMTFEPSYESVHSRVNLMPVAVAIRSEREILYNRFTPRLIGETELSWRLLRCTEKVRNSFLVLFSFVSEKFFKCFLVPSTGRSVDLVRDEVAGQGCHGLDEPCQDLVQVFVLLLGNRYIHRQELHTHHFMFGLYHNTCL